MFSFKAISIYLLLTLLISSCGFKSCQILFSRYLNTNDSLGYEISERVFENNSESGKINVSIKYPEIINLNDKYIMNKINKQIEDSAKHAYNYEENKEETGLNLSLTFTITFATKNIISVRFKGSFYRDRTSSL